MLLSSSGRESLHFPELIVEIPPIQVFGKAVTKQSYFVTALMLPKVFNQLKEVTVETN